MAIVRIQDLLERARVFELKLEKYYAAIRDESQNDGARLLTYYLCRHRRHLDQALENYSQTDIERIYRSQLKYDIEFDPETDFKLLESSPQDVKGQELLNTAVDHDTRLIQFYHGILEQPLGPEASALIQSLIKLEEKDVVMLKKMIAMNYF